jgi:transposase-like protein
MFVRVTGLWVYLHRAVNSRGATRAFDLSKNQPDAAAKRFFSKALGTANHPCPLIIDDACKLSYPKVVKELEQQEGGSVEAAGAEPVQT